MPFTPAHAAAAFPFRNSRLVWSALIVGTMAPDFEYFLHMAPEGRHGHTMPGVFLLTLPLALVTLWLFHTFVKASFVGLLPENLNRRLIPYAGEFRFGGAARFALIVASVMVGVLTHLVWDSFTHPNGWSVLHWPLLRHRVWLPIVGGVPIYKPLQHASTVFGLALLLVWLAVWYRNMDISSLPPARSESAWPPGKIATLVAISAVAAIGAVVVSLATTGMPPNIRGIPHFLVPVVVAAIALLWWELVLLGIVRSQRKTNQVVSK
jgi:hypothetical protein